MAQRAELQIVARDGRRHALLMSARVKGGDIFCGQNLVSGEKVFRQSPHMRDRQRGVIDEGGAASGSPPKLRLSAVGSDLELLDWTHRPRAGGRGRVIQIVELGRLAQYPGFTAELWAFAAGRPDLVEEHLARHYEPGGHVVAHALADWTRPTLLGVLWTLKATAWGGLRPPVGAADPGLR